MIDLLLEDSMSLALVADDDDRLLIGTAAITAALNSFEVFDRPLTESEVRRRMQMGSLPTKKFGRFHATTRRQIAETLKPLCSQT
jgi:hypothetical protein